MTESCDCGEPDCIPAGDPRYDGFRISELWLVTMVDPADDQEGLMYEAGSGPLMATDERRLEFLRAIVSRNAAEGGPPLRIRHFTEAVDVQD